ncbi:NmrA family protein [Aliidongia dinghuensis]|uniref:NmrA family protein n=1 Tax=Aliidongia dinghuensis TaxID=1867774 RepID=A0A8J3E2I8_9PROT|nr:NmrA family NAD(P)-binding protein [Aliidongia dinghuensis]GGF11328.1 NmrA family protein [Aliidongia dinghuensis]
MYVILGATGKAGRATVAALRANGAAVRAVVRDLARAEGLSALGCEIAVADLNDPAALRAAFEGATAAQIICPVPFRADDPAAEMRRTIDTVAGALAAAAVPTVLAISDYGAELAAGTGVTLAFHHMEVRLSALPASLTFLRSAEHMQNWVRVIAVAAETGILPMLHHPVTKRFPTISAPDLGPIAAALLTTPADGTGVDGAGPRIIHAEGPRRYTAEDAAAALGRIVGRPVVARELPRAQWMATLERGGLSPGYAALVSELYDAHNAGQIDAEAGVGELRRGTTDLSAVFAALLSSR